jgi:hypothetical protein
VADLLRTRGAARVLAVAVTAGRRARAGEAGRARMQGWARSTRLAGADQEGEAPPGGGHRRAAVEEDQDAVERVGDEGEGRTATPSPATCLQTETGKTKLTAM